MKRGRIPDGAGWSGRAFALRRRRLLLLLVVLLPTDARARAADEPPEAPRARSEAPPGSLAWSSTSQQQEEGERTRGIRLLWRDRPSLRFGRVLRIDFRARVQGDVRGFDPHLQTIPGTFLWSRKRLALEGTFLRDFEYEIERELRRQRPWWRDVFVNFRRFDDVQIQAGKFKLPFGLEQLTGATNLDFVYRSRISDQLAPARELGGMAHGRLFRRGFGYEAGLFRRDGENARGRGEEDLPAEFLDTATARRTMASRVTARPLRLLPVPASLKEAELGFAFTAGGLPEGLNSLRGRSFAGQSFFPRLFVKGRRIRLGAEVNWTPGPLSVRGEYIRVQDERESQGILNNDLPHMISSGWYLSGTWALTGEPKADDIEPRRPFPHRGIGAWELATRYERLSFGSSEHPGPPFRNSRAPNILGNSDTAWTFGINWYINKFGKIQGNVIRERFEDAARTPLSGQTRFWTAVARFQFVL